MLNVSKETVLIVKLWEIVFYQIKKNKFSIQTFTEQLLGPSHQAGQQGRWHIPLRGVQPAEGDKSEQTTTKEQERC